MTKLDRINTVLNKLIKSGVDPSTVRADLISYSTPVGTIPPKALR